MAYKSSSRNRWYGYRQLSTVVSVTRLDTKHYGMCSVWSTVQIKDIP